MQSITKNVYLERGKTLFQETYIVNLENIELEHFFYFRLPTGEYKIKDELDLNEEEKTVYEKLDEDILNELLVDLLEDTIKQQRPSPKMRCMA